MVRNVSARPELGLSASNALPSVNVSLRKRTDDNDSHDDRPMESSHHISVLRITDTELPSYTFSALRRISNWKRPRKTVRCMRTGSMIPCEGLGRTLTEPVDNREDGCLPIIRLTGTRANVTSTTEPTRMEGM